MIENSLFNVALLYEHLFRDDAALVSLGYNSEQRQIVKNSLDRAFKGNRTIRKLPHKRYLVYGENEAEIGPLRAGGYYLQLFNDAGDITTALRVDHAFASNNSINTLQINLLPTAPLDIHGNVHRLVPRLYEGTDYGDIPVHMCRRTIGWQMMAAFLRRIATYNAEFIDEATKIDVAVVTDWELRCTETADRAYRPTFEERKRGLDKHLWRRLATLKHSFGTYQPWGLKSQNDQNYARVFKPSFFGRPRIVASEFRESQL